MTATNTNTKTQTQTEVEVDATLVKILTESVQFEKKAESKYWLLVERAIEMFEEGREEKDIKLQFRLAYAKANKVEFMEFNQNPEYVTFRRKAILFVGIAMRGREWYDKQKKQKPPIGFYRMFNMATQEAEAEVKPKKKTKANNPAPEPEPKAAEDDSNNDGESAAPDAHEFDRQLRNDLDKFFDKSVLIEKLTTFAKSAAEGELHRDEYVETTGALDRGIPLID